MKFREYIHNLNKLLKENPKSADLYVITSHDEEGNGYGRIHYEPSIVNLADIELTDMKSVEDSEALQAVCVN